MEYALIGEHLGHSYSPEIHRMLRDYDYRLCELSPTELPAYFARRDFKGINVTIPYKQAVIPFCDTLGETARRAGAVNTIVKRSDGTLFGENTDLEGFQFMLREAEIDLTGRHVLILGGGGASRTVQLAAADAGANGVSVADLGENVNYTNIYEHCRTAQVIINATPVGMYPKACDCLVELSRFPALEAVVDLIYNPLRTCLLQQAERLNLRNINGLSMLVAQAAAAATLFTGEAQGTEEITSIIANMYHNMENWVLIGMPGCGKSTIGTYLAWRSGRSFIDLDCEIERQVGESCNDILRQRGESAFRDIESRIAQEIGTKTGLVIATGGGTVLRDRNVTALRQNSKLLWIRRDAAKLATEGRPLSVDVRALEKVRTPAYEAAADAQISHNEDWEMLQQKAWEVFHT